jgi:small subunit ribosomal protein S7
MGRITASSTTLKPDPRFGSVLASKFINCLMHDGKMADVEPIEVFNRAMDNVKPAIEVRSKRVGGAAYQVPMQVSRNRQQSLAIRWILQSVREKKGRATHEKLADEFMAAFNREGAAMTKRENVHRMADANKAFAHFAW